MSSIFGKPRLATDAEQIAYHRLRAVPYQGQINSDSFWHIGGVDYFPDSCSSFIDLDGDRACDMLSCTPDSCLVFSSAMRKQPEGGHGLLTLFLDFGNFSYTLKQIRFREVRYGDIDSNGSIDVATKLTDGAIFVWHNR